MMTMQRSEDHWDQTAGMVCDVNSHRTESDCNKITCPHVLLYHSAQADILWGHRAITLNHTLSRVSVRGHQRPQKRLGMNPKTMERGNPILDLRGGKDLRAYEVELFITEWPSWNVCSYRICWGRNKLARSHWLEGGSLRSDYRVWRARLLQTKHAPPQC